MARTKQFPQPGEPDWDPIYGGGSDATKISVNLKKTAYDYLGLLLALLPHGIAWYKDVLLGTQSPPQPQTRLQTLLLGLSWELERWDLRNDDLMNEKDPRTTNELITDWERICDIPDPCSNLSGTIEQRREVILLKLSARGGQSRKYFSDLAELLGWPNITITEYPPCTLRLANCNSQLITSSPYVPSGYEPGKGWVFVWSVENFGQKITWFRSGSAGSGDNISIEQTEDNRLKCYFKLLKPAHTTVIFPPEVI